MRPDEFQEIVELFRLLKRWREEEAVAEVEPMALAH